MAITPSGWLDPGSGPVQTPGSSPQVRDAASRRVEGEGRRVRSCARPSRRQVSSSCRQSACSTTSRPVPPTALPGWTRGHVIAHVALNGEAFVGVATALRAGRAAVMYPGDEGARDRAIDALAAAPPHELVRRVRAANDEFTRAWEPPPPAGACATSADHPAFSSSSVPQRRLRELQVHLVDLGCPGVGPALWTRAFVDADLRIQWPTVAHRTTEPILVVDEFGEVWQAGTRDRGAEPLVVPRSELLAWVLDRADVDGLPQLEPWSNQSRWEHLERDASAG